MTKVQFLTLMVVVKLSGIHKIDKTCLFWSVTLSKICTAQIIINTCFRNGQYIPTYHLLLLGHIDILLRSNATLKPSAYVCLSKHNV